AEDGIRDFHVTGVQTCALPIYHFPGARERLVERVHATMGKVVKRAEGMGCTFVIETIEYKDPRSWVELARSFNSPAMALSIDTRSEERRVGKGCSSRSSATPET